MSEIVKTDASKGLLIFMVEALKHRAVKASLATAVGLGAAACGTESSGNALAAHHTRPAPNTAKVQVKYFANGSRELLFTGLNDNDDLGHRSYHTNLEDIFQICDGRDLLEQTVGEGWAEQEGTSIARTPNYPGCSDGRLTPSDFPNSPAESNTAPQN